MTKKGGAICLSTKWKGMQDLSKTKGDKGKVVISKKKEVGNLLWQMAGPRRRCSEKKRCNPANNKYRLDNWVPWGL